jgi:hypothetical protein
MEPECTAHNRTHYVSWTSELRDAFTLTNHKDAVRAWRDTRARPVWGVWHGEFMLATPRKAHARETLRGARHAIGRIRPTRIVVVLPSGLASVTDHALAGAQWAGLVHGRRVVLFQNDTAEAVSPCRKKVLVIADELQSWSQSGWRADSYAWPEVPLQAWCLDRDTHVHARVLCGWQKYLEVGRVGGVWQAHGETLHRDALRGLLRLNDCSEYTRRLGVIPTDYSFTLTVALARVTGSRPSFAQVDDAMSKLRAEQWDSALAAFRAAHQARVWIYTSDPENELQHAEESRKALWLFQKARADRRRKSVGSAQGEAPKPLARRSRRGRVPKKVSREFYWNWSDQYVQALDEITAPTSGVIHTRIADRMKREIHAV